MASQTFTGKTGQGSASLGATRLVTDIEFRITANTAAKVRTLHTVSSTKRLQFAGSYGLFFNGGAGNLITALHPILADLVDLPYSPTNAATHVFWDLNPGITATLIVSY